MCIFLNLLKKFRVLYGIMSYFLVAAVGFLLFVESGHAATTKNTKLQSFADAYVDQAAPNTNYGSAPYLFVGIPPEFGYRQRSFLRFNTSSIPAGATIVSASLSVYLYNSTTPGIFGIDLDTVRSLWYETGPAGIVGLPL